MNKEFNYCVKDNINYELDSNSFNEFNQELYNIIDSLTKKILKYM